MNKWLQSFVIIISLIGVGELLRFPQEDLTQELKEDGFIKERLSSEKQLKLGQTSAAVVLGGLRSLVASFMNLQAFAEYEKKNWVELERLYDVIVTLQPDNSYYWEHGAWHLAYNAYFDFDEKRGMAAPRRRLKQKEYREKGESFLLRGTEENPENPRLWQSLGRLYSDPHKPYNFAKAAEYLKVASELPNAKPRLKREYFYTLGRVRGREKDALKLGAKLMADPVNSRYSSMRSQFYVLALIQKPAIGNDNVFIEQIWGDNKKAAYRDLVNYRCRTEREKFPRANLKSVINRLQEELSISDMWNPIKNPMLKRITGEF